MFFVGPRNTNILSCIFFCFLPWKEFSNCPNVSAVLKLSLYFTPWCRVLLEKLAGLQLVKKYPAFHGNRKFITALTSVSHLSLSWASPIQSTYPHPTSSRSVLILSNPSTARSHKWSLSLRFPHQAPIHAPLLTYTRRMPSQSHSSRICHLHNIGWGVQIILLLVMQSHSFRRYLVPPRSKYSPQHHVLKHPQLSFLPQCQRPSFTPIQNTRQIMFLYILIFKFLESHLEDKRFCTEW